MYSVMLVENADKWRELLIEGLTARRHNVRAVRSWQEANALLGENNHFDVIVLNLHLLADRDYLGVNVLEAVVRHSPYTPCIILTGCPDEVFSRTGRYREQVFDLLSKRGEPQGFDLDQLCRKVTQAVREKSQIVSALFDRSPEAFDSIRREFVAELTQRVAIPPDLIHIQQVEPLPHAAQVRVTIEMPAGAAQRFVQQYLDQDPMLQRFDISRVEIWRPPAETPPPPTTVPSEPPALMASRLSITDRDRLTRRLADAPQWREGQHSERIGVLLAAGLPDGYVRSWVLNGEPRAVAARVINDLEQIGRIVGAPKYCALGLLVKYLHSICPDIEGQKFLARLTIEYQLADDSAWLARVQADLN